jgi:hypothetical protein
MRPHAIRKALDQYADRALGPAPDLWPAVRRAVPGATASRIHIEPTGRRVSRLAPVLVVALALALVIGLPLLSRDRALGPAVTPAAPPSIAPAAPGDYSDLLAQKFAARLGVTPARVDTTFAAAADTAITGAVTGGAITTDAAAQARAATARGPAWLFVQSLSAPGAGPALRPGDAEATLAAVGRLFGLDAAGLRAALRGGADLTGLEQGRHVTAAQVRDAVLAVAKPALTAGAQRGDWTSAQTGATFAAISLDPAAFGAKLAAIPTGAGGP